MCGIKSKHYSVRFPKVTELYTKGADHQAVWHYEICTKWYQTERNAVFGKAVAVGVSIYHNYGW